MGPQEALPVIPMRDVVVFPQMMRPFTIGRPSSVRAVEHAFLKHKHVFLATQRDATLEKPTREDVYATGCVAEVVAAKKQSDGSIQVFIDCIHRARVVDWNEEQGFVVALVNIMAGVPGERDEAQMSRVVSLFEKYVSLNDTFDFCEMITADRVDNPSKLADTIAAHVRMNVEEKQGLLEILSPNDRLAHLEVILTATVRRLRTSSAESGA